jgi:hypothetical protein
LFEIPGEAECGEGERGEAIAGFMGFDPAAIPAICSGEPVRSIRVQVQPNVMKLVVKKDLFTVI